MKNRQSGLTMIEVVIASVILVAVSAMAMALLLNSSSHVSNMQVGVTLEQAGREVISQISAELRQAKMSSVELLNTKLGPLYTVTTTFTQANLAAAMTDPTTLPGSGTTRAATQDATKTIASVAGSPAYYSSPYLTGSIPANTDYRSGPPAYPLPTGVTLTPPYEAQVIFNGIRFHIPGHQLDLTTLNANADAGNPKDNFDLARFKANPSGNDWVTEIQYWWEADAVVAGAPLSAGVVKKAETIRNSSGVLVVRHVTVVARNVAQLQFMIPMYTPFVDPYKDWVTWLNLPSSPQPANYTVGSSKPAFAANYKYTTALPERQIYVGIQLNEPDPGHPSDATKNILRTLSATVEARN